MEFLLCPRCPEQELVAGERPWSGPRLAAELLTRPQEMGIIKCNFSFSLL